MDFSNIKSLSIPQGSVKKIKANGVELWEKQSEPPLDKYSFEAVIQSIQAGTYATDYQVGDLIPLDLGVEGLLDMEIACFDVGTRSDGLGAPHIHFVARQLLTSKVKWGVSTSTNWSNSTVFSFLHNSILPLLPQNVTNAIVEVDLEYSRQNKLFIPHYKNEMETGKIYYSVLGTTTQRAKGSAWWIRDLNSNNAYGAVVARTGDALVTGYSYYSGTHNILMCFCL